MSSTIIHGKAIILGYNYNVVLTFLIFVNIEAEVMASYYGFIKKCVSSKLVNNLLSAKLY